MSAENLVSVDIPDEDIKKVLDALTTVSDILRKYLIALSPDERQRMLKMGVSYCLKSCFNYPAWAGIFICS